jgi:hypothetical protein
MIIEVSGMKKYKKGTYKNLAGAQTTHIIIWASSYPHPIPVFIFPVFVHWVVVVVVVVVAVWSLGIVFLSFSMVLGWSLSLSQYCLSHPVIIQQ